MNERNYTSKLPMFSTWCEINLTALEENLKQIKVLAARNKFEIPTRGEYKPVHTSLMGILMVIKADAYGHGMMAIGQHLNDLGVDIFGVSDINEGIVLRDQGITKPILLFESTLPEHIPFICEYDLTPTVCSLEFAERLDACAKKTDKLIKIHVEIDTGMGRLGVWQADAFDFIKQISSFRNILTEGIFTHFPVADTDRKFTENQISQLYELVSTLDREGIIIPFVHASNSMGLMGYRTSVLNLFRPGLMVYGLYPDRKTECPVELKPVLSVKSKVIFVKEIDKGRGISYGRTFVAKKRMRVATIPIGYNDGYFREFSNKADVLINGQRCPVIGTVTMDQIIVDVSHVEKVDIGTEVIILGAQLSEEISADELAQHVKTINYEIVCNLGNRLPRVYTG